MAYAEPLADRVRDTLKKKRGISVVEKKMFGGLAFMVDGHMTLGIVGLALMVRVGKDAYEAALGMKGAGEMDFTGRPMRGFVLVGGSGYATDTQLEEWVGMALAHTKSLPPKKK